MIETEDTEGVDVSDLLKKDGAILGLSVGVIVDGAVNGDEDGIEDTDIDEGMEL